MNPEHGPDLAGAARSRLHPALAAALNASQAPAPDPALPERAETERSTLATHRDPSLMSSDRADQDPPGAEPPDPDAAEAEREARGRTQVRWVRPTELALQGSARATGWGLDLRTELTQRLRDHRTGRTQGHGTDPRAGRGERVSGLPDLSITGRRRVARQVPARSGMGLR